MCRESCSFFSYLFWIPRMLAETKPSSGIRQWIQSQFYIEVFFISLVHEETPGTHHLPGAWDTQINTLTILKEPSV